MEWETVIGLEIHVQLATNTKYFQVQALHLVQSQTLKLVPLT